MRHLTTLDTFEPFAALGRLRNDIDRLFATGGSPDLGHTPPLSLTETETGYEVRLPLAGADPERLEVNVEGDVLRVTGERGGVPEGATRRFAVERLTGRFLRELRLPAAIDTAKVSAAYEHGILRIALPKAPEALPRSVEVSWS